MRRNGGEISEVFQIHRVAPELPLLRRADHRQRRDGQGLVGRGGKRGDGTAKWIYEVDERKSRSHQEGAEARNTSLLDCGE